MTVTLYKSTDANAPVLCGQCGKMVQLLDAILVNGYAGKASQGWSIAYTGYAYSGTATGGANNKLIDTTRNFTVDGVTIGMCVLRTADGKSAGITSISTTTNANDTLNFTAAANTPTFANLDAYTIDGNRRVYRAPTGNRYYLRVEDLLTGGANQCARVRGWEVKSNTLDVVDASNTGPFPTNAQVDGGLWGFKSSTASATAVAWYFIGNGTFFLLWVNQSGTAGAATAIMFGDYVSFKPGDMYNTIIQANSSGAANTVYLWYSVSAGGGYQVRLNSGQGGSVALSRMPPTGTTWVATHFSIGSYVYPDTIVGGLLVTPILVTTGGIICGYIPGWWNSLHPTFAHGDICAGAVGTVLAGKTFEFWVLGSGGGTGAMWIETSDTW